jgi:5-methylcytosine-specific restriction enzyme A
MPRSVSEWIAKNDDSPIPPRVRLRVFERYGGICYLSSRQIRPGDVWAVDHIVSLINGGEHRESNLAPVLVEPHKKKTKADLAEKAIVAKKRKTHLGIRAKKRKMGYRKFNGEVVKPRWG